MHERFKYKKRIVAFRKCFTQQVQQEAMRTSTRFLLMFVLQTLETDFRKVTGADLFPHDCLGYRFPLAIFRLA